MDGIADVAQAGGQAIVIALGCPAAGEAHGLAFNGDTRLHHVVHHIWLVSQYEGEEFAENRNVGFCYHRADAMTDLYSANHRQRSERFPQYRAADA